MYRFRMASTFKPPGLDSSCKLCFWTCSIFIDNPRRIVAAEADPRRVTREPVRLPENVASAEPPLQKPGPPDFAVRERRDGPGLADSSAGPPSPLALSV